MKLVLWAFGALVLLLVAGLALKATEFSRLVTVRETLVAANAPGALRDDLPPMVAAFAARGMQGATPVGAVRLTQTAEMRLKRGADWSPLVARQVIGAAIPGFVWVAEQRLGPVPMVRVIDSYASGGGLLEVRLLGAVRLGRYDGPEAALSEALRYLAELPWAPDAILTNREIVWTEAPDGLHARLATAGGPAEVVFGLDAAGDIVSMAATGRPATMPDGTIQPLDWRGSFGDYALIGGRRIPTTGEVGYVYPEGYEAYFRGRVTSYEPLAMPR